MATQAIRTVVEETGYVIDREEYAALPEGCFYIAYPDDRADYHVNRGVFATGNTMALAIERLHDRLSRRLAA